MKTGSPGTGLQTPGRSPGTKMHSPGTTLGHVFPGPPGNPRVCILKSPGSAPSVPGLKHWSLRTSVSGQGRPKEDTSADAALGVRSKTDIKFCGMSQRSGAPGQGVRPPSPFWPGRSKPQPPCIPRMKQGASSLLHTWDAWSSGGGGDCPIPQCGTP